MEKLYSRRFDVDFYEKNENTWVARSRLVDDVHEISTEVEVAVPEMIILDAKIHFNRYPLDVCPKIEKKAKKLVGLNLFKKLSMEITDDFLRIQGMWKCLVNSRPWIAISYLYLLPASNKNRKDEHRRMGEVYGNEIEASMSGTHFI